MQQTEKEQTAIPYNKYQTQPTQQNPIALLNDPSRFIRNFQLSTLYTSQLISSQQYEKAIYSLTKNLDILDLGHQILKSISPYWKLCIYGNLAMCYQRLWKIDKANKYCIKIIGQLQNFITNQTKTQVRLFLMKKMLKVKFQHCAILSQTNHHPQALQVCKQIFQILQNYLENIQSFIKNIEKPKANKCIDNVFFIQQVVGFAQQITENMLKTLKQPVKQGNQKKTQFYFWVQNPAKNQQQIKRLLFRNKNPQECKRSILGVNKNRLQISEFNIGSIMHIQQYNVNQFKKTPPLKQYLFRDKIFENIIYCSMAYFTLATELRFKQALKDQMKSKCDMINKKYGYDEKTDAYRLSEVYHLKSIDIVANNIPVSLPYLTHIIKSYQKHYIINKPLPVIKSIVDESAVSINTLKGEKSTQQYQNFNEYLSFENNFDNLTLKVKHARSISRAPQNSRSQCVENLGCQIQDIKPIKNIKQIRSQKKEGGDYQIQMFNNSNKKKKNSSMGKNNTKYKKNLRENDSLHKRSLSQGKFTQKKEEPDKNCTTSKKKNILHHKVKKNKYKQ